MDVISVVSTCQYSVEMVVITFRNQRVVSVKVRKVDKSSGGGREIYLERRKEDAYYNAHHRCLSPRKSCRIQYMKF